MVLVAAPGSLLEVTYKVVVEGVLHKALLEAMLGAVFKAREKGSEVLLGAIMTSCESTLLARVEWAQRYAVGWYQKHSLRKVSQGPVLEMTSGALLKEQSWR